MPDNDLPDMEPLHDLFTPFHGPLTADDIARIERGMNVLVSQLFSSASDDELEEELAAPLAEKIDAYIGIADHAAADPDFDMPLEFRHLLQERLRELLQKVNEYDHKLN